MKWIALILLIPILFQLSACTPVSSQVKQAPTTTISMTETLTPMSATRVPAQLKDFGPAPEWNNSVWINTDHPLRLADLRGKVVLMDMWTFDCINCQHVLPYLKSWYARYQQEGLVIIGNHTPEFDYEADPGNLKKAVEQNQITYPVAQDNDWKTWNAFHNQYWPTMYLIDKQGHIRYIQIGEGAYDQTEQAIQTLLAENPGS